MRSHVVPYAAPGILTGTVLALARALGEAAPLILVSLGMTLVIAVRGLDISVGAVLAIAATVAAWTITRMTTGGGDGLAPLFAAIGAALAAAALCGLWNGLLVVKVGMQPIIATLILMVAGRGIAQLVSDGQILTIYYAPYGFLGTGFLLGLPFEWTEIMLILLPIIGPLFPLLDFGAHGIMFPRIDSVEDTTAAVGTIRYPRAGVRGVGGARAALADGPLDGVIAATVQFFADHVVTFDLKTQAARPLTATERESLEAARES